MNTRQSCAQAAKSLHNLPDESAAWLDVQDKTLIRQTRMNLLEFLHKNGYVITVPGSTRIKRDPSIRVSLLPVIGYQVVRGPVEAPEYPRGRYFEDKPNGGREVWETAHASYEVRPFSVCCAYLERHSGEGWRIERVVEGELEMVAYRFE